MFSLSSTGVWSAVVCFADDSFSIFDLSCCYFFGLGVVNIGVYFAFSIKCIWCFETNLLWILRLGLRVGLGLLCLIGLCEVSPFFSYRRVCFRRVDYEHVDVWFGDFSFTIDYFNDKLGILAGVFGRLILSIFRLFGLACRRFLDVKSEHNT